MDVDDYFLRNSLWPAVVYTILMMLLGLIGNTLVLVLYRNDYYKSMKWVFIYFLAVLDILSCLISMPADLTILFHMTSFPSWPWCKISRYLSYVFHGASCVILMIIAFNRYYTICKGSIKGLNRTKAKRICIGVIIFAVIVDSPSLLLYGELIVPIAIQDNSARIISKVEYVRILVHKNRTDWQTNGTAPNASQPELFFGRMCSIGSEYSESFLTKAFILFQFIMFAVLVISVTFFYIKIIQKLMGYRDQQERRFSVHFPKKRSIGLEETSTSHVSIQDTFSALQPELQASKDINTNVSNGTHSSKDINTNVSNGTHSSQEDPSEYKYENGTSPTSPEKNKSNSKNKIVDNIETKTGSVDDIETTNGSVDNIKTKTGSVNNIETKTGSMNNIETTNGSVDIIKTKTGSMNNIETKTGSVDIMKTKTGSMNNIETTTGDGPQVENGPSQSGGCGGNSDSDGENHRTFKSGENSCSKSPKRVTQSSVTFNVTEKDIEICPQPPKKPIRLNSISSVHSSSESLPTTPTFRGRLSSILGTVGRKPRRRLSVKPIQSLRSSVMLLSISLAFILSFLPFWIIVIWRSIVGSSFVTSLNSTTYGLVTLFARSALVSNAINPILYAFLNSQFRKRCKSICKRRYY